jgi:hypothetical protein
LKHQFKEIVCQISTAILPIHQFMGKIPPQNIATWDELVIFTSKNLRAQKSHQQIDPPVTKTATPSGKSSGKNLTGST